MRHRAHAPRVRTLGAVHPSVAPGAGYGGRQERPRAAQDAQEAGQLRPAGDLRQRVPAAVREEPEVLFTQLAERYERRSLGITSNLVFSEWEKVFANPMATAAAIDRIVHHSVILEFDVPSYRTNAARNRQVGRESDRQE